MSPPALETPNTEKSKLSKKRVGYLEWNEYFMAIAFLSAQRSKDPRTQVGACIVNSDKKIVGIGYNGMPIGCDDDIMPWNRAENDSKDMWFESKTPYVCHAELNAVLNKNLADVKGCVIYVALFPCNMCAQIIIQSRISEVIYYSDKYHDKLEFKASRRLFDTAGIKYRQFKPRQKKIIIDFDLIEPSPEESSVPSTKNYNDSNSMELHGSNKNNSNDMELTANNNSGSMKNFRIENHPEQQQLQGIDDLLPQEIIRPSGTIGVSNSHEHKFAVFSTLFFVLMAVLIWFINNSDVVVGIN